MGSGTVGGGEGGPTSAGKAEMWGEIWGSGEIYLERVPEEGVGLRCGVAYQ